MKKFTLAIFSLLLAATGFAKEVTQTEAVDVAQRMMKQRNVKVTEVSSVTPISFNGQKAYYAVQFLPEGWALISADDVATPLIGYSNKGAFPVLNMPDNMRGWLDMGAKQVSEFKKYSDERNVDWDKMEIVPMATTDNISPLITVQWNQSGKNYNKYCPSNSSGTAVVGCVAVAMAQAMTVPQYPERPEGSITYTSANFGSITCNFSNEPVYNWSNIMTGANNNDDVARLLWHCGAATRMEYGVGGSGTMTSYVPGALKSYFGYPSSVTYISRDSYNDTDWNAILLGELQAGRPIVYCGYPSDGTAGHCFNLDGYDGAFYHVNWGWGGAGDGNYSLDNLKAAVVPGGPTMEFTQGHGMVIGIRTPNNNPSNITLSNTSVALNQPVGTVVGAVTVESDAKDPIYSYEVKGKKSFIGYKSAPFEVKDGNLVTTAVLTASNFTDGLGDQCEVNITATNTALGTSVTRTFQLSIKNSTGINDVMIDESAPVEYYNLQGVKVENPEKGIFIKRQGSKATKIVL